MSGPTLRDATAGGRELAVLVNGPWAPRWYWRTDLEAMQEASRRTGHPDGHPAAELRGYRPTDQWVGHPAEPEVSGRAWRFRSTAAHDTRLESRTEGGGSDVH